MRLFSLETKKVNFVPLTFLFFVSPLDLRDAFFFTGGLLDGPDCIHIIIQPPDFITGPGAMSFESDGMILGDSQLMCLEFQFAIFSINNRQNLSFI